jgi:hypothetical protein
MPRHPRLFLFGELYHVYCRVARKDARFIYSVILGRSPSEKTECANLALFSILNAELRTWVLLGTKAAALRHRLIFTLVIGSEGISIRKKDQKHVNGSLLHLVPTQGTRE